ncbi:11436_t:CDS:2, partial [Gigaspora rosea]
MSRQTFISNPKSDKTYIYKSPNNKYQQFTNAFVYHFMVENENLNPIICDTAAREWKNIKMFEETKINDIIKGYLATPIKLRGFIGSTVLSQKTTVPEITVSSSRAVTAIPIEQEIPNNAPAQKWAVCSIEAAKTKIKELEQVCNFTSDSQLRCDLYSRSKYHSKKVKALEEQQEVVQYDKCGRPSYLLRNPDLLEHIYDSIEYGSADTQRHKEAIKVRIVNHLRENLEKKLWYLYGKNNPKQLPFASSFQLTCSKGALSSHL